MEKCPICKLPFASRAQGSPRCKVQHHCHLEDLSKHLLRIAPPRIREKSKQLRKELSMISKKYNRFQRTKICADCNSADKDLKAIVGAQSLFSYSPEEIGLFLTRDRDGNRIIDERVAIEIYKNAKSDFGERLIKLRTELEKSIMKI